MKLADHLKYKNIKIKHKKYNKAFANKIFTMKINVLV